MNTAFKLAILTAVLLVTAGCTAPPPPRVNTPAASQPAGQPAIEPPVVTDIQGSRESAPASEVKLTCMANNKGGGTLAYSWSVDKGTIRDEGKPAGSVVTWITPATVENCTVTVKVTNSKGGEASFSRSFSVVANPFGNFSPDPTIYLRFDMPSGALVKESRPAVVMEMSEIQCMVQDQDPGTMTFKWSAPIGKLMGSNIEEGHASRAGWVAPGVPGQYTVNVVVTDKQGRQAKGQVEFDVTAMRQ